MNEKICENIFQSLVLLKTVLFSGESAERVAAIKKALTETLAMLEAQARVDKMKKGDGDS